MPGFPGGGIGGHTDGALVDVSPVHMLLEIQVVDALVRGSGVLDSHAVVAIVEGSRDVVRTLVVDVQPDVASVPLVKVVVDSLVDTVQVSEELVENVWRESLIETVVDRVPSEPVV